MEILLDVEKVKNNSWRKFDAGTIALMLETSGLKGMGWTHPVYDEECPIRINNRMAYTAYEDSQSTGSSWEKEETQKLWKIYLGMDSGTVSGHLVEFERETFAEVTAFLARFAVSFEVTNYGWTEDEELDNEITAEKDGELYRAKRDFVEKMYNSDPEEEEEKEVA